MKIRRRLELVIETQTRQVVTAASYGSVESNFSAEGDCEARWCPACAAAVVMVSPEDAIRIAGVSARSVYRLVESGRIHFAETQEGVLLVCLASLGLVGTTNQLAPDLDQ